MYILLVYTVKIYHKIDHFIISRTKVENRKPPLKLKIVIKECFSNVRVRRAGRYVLGKWLVVVSKSQTGSKDRHYPRTSLSGWKFGAYVHSHPELRQEMYCAEKWAPCQLLPPPSSLRGEVRRQGLLAKPWSPTLGSEPQLHWGQPPWQVWLGSKGGGWWWPQNPVLRFKWPHLASDSAALQRNCALDKCTIVSNALNSLTGPQGQEWCHWKVDTPPWAPNLHQEAAEALGKPTSSRHVTCNNAGKLPWVRVICRLLIFKNQNWSALYLNRLR